MRFGVLLLLLNCDADWEAAGWTFQKKMDRIQASIRHSGIRRERSTSPTALDICARIPVFQSAQLELLPMMP